MKERFCELAKVCGADIIGFASSGRFEKDSPIFRLMPDAKTVIGLAFRVLRGAYRGIEEGSTYYQYSTMGVTNMEETVMPAALLRLSMFIEENGATALPQRRHQQIMAEDDSTNPEISYDAIYRGKVNETQLDFVDTAVKCGLGEKSFHGTLLTDEFGPMVRLCFIITDMEFDETPVYKPHLCDNCGKCRSACHGNAISDEGKVDVWKCSVYYKGANGTKNPFMPPDAFAELEDRIDIIAGEAEMSPEKARKIIDSTHFYPPVGHMYQSSICGRACDVACYIHLEEKGVLTKKFKTPFRKREEWKFDIESFK
ncbi:MAG: hypothetical protein IKV97_01390 [Clostridia bacterium]|nr:hypothetical protein [Clostridia bacterium]